MYKTHDNNTLVVEVRLINVGNETKHNEFI